jgi:L,D-transpeptidase ErfK/SrfK
MREEDPDLPAVVPPGPENPLGAYALYLGWPEYLIHGTNKPYGIGRRVSSGCIRLYSEDIAFLYEHVPPGIPVYVVDQPVKAGWIEGDFYIEAHPVKEELDFMEASGQIERTKMSSEDVALILEQAGEKMSEKLDWPAIREAVEQRRGVPVKIASGSGQESKKNSNNAKEPDYREITKGNSRVEAQQTKNKPNKSEREKDTQEAREIKMNLNS